MDREAWSIAVQALHCPARREAGQRSCGGTGQGLQGRTAQLLAPPSRTPPYSALSTAARGSGFGCGAPHRRLCGAWVGSGASMRPTRQGRGGPAQPRKGPDLYVHAPPRRRARARRRRGRPDPLRRPGPPARGRQALNGRPHPPGAPGRPDSRSPVRSAYGLLPNNEDSS
jgi:hypothetical protein